MNWSFVSAGKSLIFHNENLQESLFQLSPHSLDITCCTFNHNSNVLASSSLDGKIKLSHLVNKKEILVLDNKSSNVGVNSIAFSGNCFSLVAGQTDGALKIWDLQNSSNIHQTNVKHQEITSVSWDSVSGMIAYATSLGIFNLMESKKYSTIASYSSKSFSSFMSIKFSPSYKNLICAASSDGSIVLFNSEISDLAPRSWQLHSNKCTSVTFSPVHENLLISVGLDENVGFMDFREKKVMKGFSVNSPITASSISLSGLNLIVGTYFGDIINIDLRKAPGIIARYKGHDKVIISSIDYVKAKKKEGSDSNSNQSLLKSKNDIDVELKSS